MTLTAQYRSAHVGNAAQHRAGQQSMTTQHSIAQCVPAQHSIAQESTAWHSTAEQSSTHHSRAKLNTAQQATAAQYDCNISLPTVDAHVTRLLSFRQQISLLHEGRMYGQSRHTCQGDACQA